ncbi:predicted protein [Histoplasma mississippiense (nom. inval.)]|uniref:predicted protein n=1 Tax=Ajellomyces capsulatus (strain NAm1 / WU24) TaxID=2059318 RepID=UPI000157B4DD|nr:predicted protein [Histoplasma mississippiense (nom. inval.)]EDN03054.1 predicted protein [Histoplasma mississippiense (nom. inval.)]
MAELSDHDCDIITNHPLSDSLYRLQDLLQEAEQAYNATTDPQDAICQRAISKLLTTLMGEEAAFNLRFPASNKNVASELSRLFTCLQDGDFSYEHYRTLVRLKIQKATNVDIWKAVLDLITTVSRATPPPRTVSSIPQTPWLRNTSSFVNSTEYQKHVDFVLKEELGEIHVDIPGFFDAYFGNIPQLTATSQAVLEGCKRGDNPLYTEAQEPSWKIDRRPLAQPSQPLQGSIAERKLDIGFVDDLTATEDSRCRWSQILVPGELKNDLKYDRKSGAWFDLGRYSREVLSAQDTRRFVLGFTLCGPFLRLWNFDRLGGIASEEFNINQDGLQFVSVVLGFLLMSREQLGFDPTIVTTGTERYIEIEKDGTKEQLIIDGIVGRARCVAGRATTCWKAHCETDKLRTPLVVKDSWQYPERTEEGELLREAMAKGVKNVAKYYHHETVHIDGKVDDVLAIRKGLSIPTKDEKGGFKATVRRSMSQRGQKSQGSTAGQKRSSDCVDTALPPPPSKRTQSSSPSKPAGGSTQLNRVHRRVVIRDYGKPIYQSSSKAVLLAALAGCIEGYMSLHDEAGLIQCDVSPRNLMVNEDKDNPSWPAFLIDLDLAIRVQRDASSGARGKTGTRAFMAIGVLYGEKHCFMHDLESFFWVLFWICIHYDGPGKGSTVERFEKWNYMSTEELAAAKQGVISEESDFLRIAGDYFTPSYQSFISCVNRLRRLVFPNGGRWKKENSNPSRNMIETLQDGENNPNIVN